MYFPSLFGRKVALLKVQYVRRIIPSFLEKDFAICSDKCTVLNAESYGY